MSQGVFITGTDTGIGKTWSTVALMENLKAQGRRVCGMKPVASGAEHIDGKLVNDDARLIMQHGSEPIEYSVINPCVFEMPVSPHIAASRTNEKINFEKIVSCYEKLASSFDDIIVEGVGGWRVPLSNEETVVDLVQTLNLPVILVVGIKLGCINHAKLTAESILADDIRLAGWISNRVDDDCLCFNETIETLKKDINCPYIAEMPHMKNFEPERIIIKEDLVGIF